MIEHGPSACWSKSRATTSRRSEMGTEDETVAVGRCPKHGIVWGDDALVNFPMRAECDVGHDCGRALEQAGYADERKVKKIAE